MTKTDYDQRIKDATTILISLDPAMKSQKRFIQEIEIKKKELNKKHKLELNYVEQELAEAKRIFNRMVKAKRDINKELKTAKTGKSQYPSRMRKYTIEHFGEVFDLFEKQALTETKVSK